MILLEKIGITSLVKDFMSDFAGKKELSKDSKKAKKFKGKH